MVDAAPRFSFHRPQTMLTIFTGWSVSHTCVRQPSSTVLLVHTPGPLSVYSSGPVMAIRAGYHAVAP